MVFHARAALPGLFASLALAVGEASPRPPPRRVSLGRVAATPESSRTVDAACPRGTLPDGDVCVHLPSGEELGAEEAQVAANAHRTRSGRWQSYEEIPRRPDRPADYDAYRYPIPPGLPGGHSVVSGFDLDRRDEDQRRGRTLHAVGHGGVDLPQARGTPVKLVALEHQEGDAEALYVGPLFGTTVLTRQTVREGGRSRDYLVLFGHLDGVAAGVHAGTVLRDGDVVGYVGDTGSPELVHLHWEARRARDGVSLEAAIKQGGGGAALSDEVSVVCDPRNVLPLK